MKNLKITLATLLFASGAVLAGEGHQHEAPAAPSDPCAMNHSATEMSRMNDQEHEQMMKMKQACADKNKADSSASDQQPSHEHQHQHEH
ncbi:MAG: hypothetical protein KAG87_13660 [Marinobacter adhaerens]|uniref:Uncharacterized protein n=1 Tax=Oceanococcus atlanticus TaxID=1317117 RepID=A0A1Y1SGL3_9GAMM|nr:hypothetical protein [Oceanococcus atlanticus]MCK5866202.1 hypothetical protein [Marinobacter adhaerens]ORE88805.1 hypothetical protein ATO7_02980 [Oceanococcus atlanticus]RZO84327.1 MAG: hypothetical protein EVA65_12085 [Oceanococcus sp.]